jgi:hypothetical protein
MSRRIFNISQIKNLLVSFHYLYEFPLLIHLKEYLTAQINMERESGGLQPEIPPSPQKPICLVSKDHIFDPTFEEYKQDISARKSNLQPGEDLKKGMFKNYKMGDPVRGTRQKIARLAASTAEAASSPETLTDSSDAEGPVTSEGDENESWESDSGEENVTSDNLMDLDVDTGNATFSTS